MLRRADEAEVGVGTLIIFIAMVLVAAVAAAVIIGTSGTLQARAQATGNEAEREVSDNLRVVEIWGARNTTADPVYDIKIHVALAAGGEAMDLSRLVIRYSDGTAPMLYAYAPGTLADGAAPNANFTATWIRGGAASAVIRSGDLVEIHFNLDGTSLAAREPIEIQLVPESGAPVEIALRGPATYATDLVMPLT